MHNLANIQGTLLASLLGNVNVASQCISGCKLSSSYSNQVKNTKVLHKIINCFKTLSKLDASTDVP